MKVLEINNHQYRTGGAEVIYLSTIELLISKGHEVIAFSRKNEYTLHTTDKEYFINYSNKFIDRFHNKKSASKMEEIILKEAPQVAHIHSITGGITFSILPVLNKYKIPIVATIHDFKYICPNYNFINGKGKTCEACIPGRYYYCLINNCSKAGRYRSLLLAVDSYFRDIFYPYWKLIDKFIFVSKFVRDKFYQVHEDIKIKSEHIYNFVNRFELTPAELSGDYFLFYGRLTDEKGIKTLLDAFKIRQELKLKIAGEGYLREFILNNKTSNVDYIGFKSGTDLEDLIKKSKFVIIPSEWYENNPMAIVESYSLGKPVLASDIGGITEIVVDTKTGFLFEAKDSLALSGLLLKCSIMNLDEYRKFSVNAFDFAKKNFSSEIYYEKLERIFYSLIQ